MPTTVYALALAGAVCNAGATILIRRGLRDASPYTGVWINLAVPLSSGSLEGLGRYAAVLFPFPLWLASTQGVASHHRTLAIFGMFYVICFTLWVKLYPLF